MMMDHPRKARSSSLSIEIQHDDEEDEEVIWFTGSDEESDVMEFLNSVSIGSGTKKGMTKSSSNNSSKPAFRKSVEQPKTKSVVNIQQHW